MVRARKSLGQETPGKGNDHDPKGSASATELQELFQIHPDIIVGVQDSQGTLYLVVVVTHDYRLSGANWQFRAFREHWFQTGETLEDLDQADMVMEVLADGGQGPLQQWWDSNGAGLSFRFRSPWQLHPTQWIAQNEPAIQHPEGSTGFSTDVDGDPLYLVLHPDESGQLSRVVWYAEAGTNPVVFSGGSDPREWVPIQDLGQIPPELHYFDERIC